MSDVPAATDLSAVSLEHGSFSIRFENSAEHGGYGFRISCTDERNRWSAPLNPFVRGASFDLYPQSLVTANADCVELRGRQSARNPAGEIFDYDYRVRASRAASGPWLRIDVELDLEDDLQLDFGRGYEPELTVDLGELPPYERGDHVWFVTHVRNPTKWNDEEFGNDMPACYVFDPYLNLELQLFFDFEAMNWMSFENLSRYFCYRCGYRRSYPAPRGRADFGLFAERYSGKTIRRGKVRFAYYLAGRHRDGQSDAPTAAEALQTLVDDCLLLLPASAPWPPGAESWRETALGCARDMNTEGLAWRRDADGHEYILNYVSGHSPAWKAVAEARGAKFDMDVPCLDTAAWTVISLDPLVAMRPDDGPSFDQLRQRLLRFIRDRVDDTLGIRFDTPGGTSRSPSTRPLGCWQYVFDLHTLLLTGRRNGLNQLVAKTEAEVDAFLVPAARTFGYLFPLQWHLADCRPVRTGDTHGIAALYATIMLDRYERDRNRQWLNEAENSMAALMRLPLNAVHQEIFLLGFAVRAAARLFLATHSFRHERSYRYFLAQTLRAIYWSRDRNIPAWDAINVTGMFNACSPINYSAIFENIETLAQIAPTLKTFPPSEGLLKVFNLNRTNNLHYYPKYLPPALRPSAALYIPREDIPQFGGPDAFIGQALYGAGYTFRAYTLWEAYAFAEDRNVMVLHLDAYEEPSRHGEHHFLIYNPLSRCVATRVRLPLLGREKGTWRLGAQSAGAPVASGATDQGGLMIEIGESEHLYLEVTVI